MSPVLRKPVLLFALALAVIAGVLVAVWPREPYYEGKPFSYWLNYMVGTPSVVGKQALLETNLLLMIKARYAVDEIGAQGLPVLLRQLQTRQPILERLEMWLIGKLHIRTNRVYGGDAIPMVKRWQAIRAIQQLGDAAKPILPQVIAVAERNRDPFVREDALQLLSTWQPAEYAKLTAAQNTGVAAR